MSGVAWPQPNRVPDQSIVQKEVTVVPAPKLVLGIETSCDETSAAVVADGRRILSNVISSQIPVHRRYGGVVPEIASRQHVLAITPVVDAALAEAGVALSDLSAVAVTAGPGLVGALLVGLSYAKALAYARRLPLLGVNHLEGHIYANWLAHDVQFPILCLVVSGGHTDLIFLPRHGHYQLLGQTRDDAAGEAFDKVARALGLPYPGGPEIDRQAADGNPQAFAFPRAMLDESSLDFSFSGLKSAVLNTIHHLRQTGEPVPVPDLAASFQEAVVDVLVAKTLAAALQLGVSSIYVAGGVSANQRLRQRLTAAAADRGYSVGFPPLVLCTDNAAMIAAAGYYRWQAGVTSNLYLNATPQLPLSSWQ